MIPLFKDETWITQYFGPSAFASKNYKTGYHEGIDLVPQGRKHWELFTPVSGEIMHAALGSDYGNNIILYDEHRGLSFRFCHLDSMVVTVGDKVKSGDIIGVSGNTGNSSAAHLHLNVVPMYEYGVKDFDNNGTNGRVDPLGVLRALGVWI